MFCYRPIRVKVPYPDGTYYYRNVPCGKCYGCLMNKQQDWVNRMIEEQKVAKSSFFITLTYDDSNVPVTSFGTLTLVKTDFQKFMKRFRKIYGGSIRFFGCGEYGSNTCRPHYHLCVFLDRNISLDSLYFLVSEAWKDGFVTVSLISENRMAYTAKYCLKSAKYPEHSEKPFLLMSRRPGLGFDYLTDASNSDFLVDHPFLVKPGGVKQRLPRYYREKLELPKDLSKDICDKDFFWLDSRWDRIKAFEAKINKRFKNDVL